jgi:hypothetical protein
MMYCSLAKFRARSRIAVWSSVRSKQRPVERVLDAPFVGVPFETLVIFDNERNWNISIRVNRFVVSSQELLYTIVNFQLAKVFGDNTTWKYQIVLRPRLFVSVINKRLKSLNLHYNSSNFTINQYLGVNSLAFHRIFCGMGHTLWPVCSMKILVT